MRITWDGSNPGMGFYYSGAILSMALSSPWIRSTSTLPSLQICARCKVTLLRTTNSHATPWCTKFAIDNSTFGADNFQVHLPRWGQSLAASARVAWCAPAWLLYHARLTCNYVSTYSCLSSELQADTASERSATPHQVWGNARASACLFPLSV